MKITIISYDNWGFNAYIVSILKEKGHIVNHIDLSSFLYKYPNILYKLYNFFLKTFFKINLKTLFYGKKVNEILKENDEIQDIILVIKGDFIDRKSILKIKKHSKKTIGYFNDNTKRCPKIIRVIPAFDEVYSFEKEDCEKYNLKFIANWIYDSNNKTSEIKENKFKYQIFNVSSIDKRLQILSKIAAHLFEKNIDYKFIIYDKKNKNNNNDKNIEFATKQIPLNEVTNYIQNAKVLLDINRKKQLGLSFRVFESLGLEKKLITTNPDIKYYDFYNPNNILILDEKNINIPLDFFNTEYKKIPEDILEKYTLEGWINKVLINNNN